MSNPVYVPALVVGAPLVSLPGTAVIAGSVAYQYVEKTSNYTASDSDKTIHVTANSVTITLPTASGIPGREYFIKNTGAGNVTVATTGGQTIDGNATWVLQKDSNPNHVNGIAVLSTGVNWITTSQITN